MLIKTENDNIKSKDSLISMHFNILLLMKTKGPLNTYPSTATNDITTRRKQISVTEGEGQPTSQANPKSNLPCCFFSS